MNLLNLMLPEAVLITVACVLFLVGCSKKPTARRVVAPGLALLALVVALLLQFGRVTDAGPALTATDAQHTFRIYAFGQYVKLLAAAVGILLVLLAWPTDRDGTGNAAMNFGEESGEFFALMLLSISGIFLVAGANDMILLFLGIELASIPTYIMVSISRPLPVAQEAGVKYFFLGAMSAAVMLFGFSYLYGVTGTTDLHAIRAMLHPPVAAGTSLMRMDPATAVMGAWPMLAVVMLIAGFAFKLAAVPLHVYAGDVYQGAATPVTAFLSFVPKTSGIVALMKILSVAGGERWAIDPHIVKMLWVIAALTMTIGNVLGLLQHNIKRLFAYSSIAHSGYMLVGLTALAGAYAWGASDPGLAGNPALRAKTVGAIQTQALQGVLFYLAAYGIMNAGAFGVLMMLPSRDPRPGTSAETFEDIAGQGRRHIRLGLAMAVCCFSLIGIPLTVGFVGKLMLLLPGFKVHNTWLGVITVVNAAISAAYYLRIVGTMFLRPLPAADSLATTDEAYEAPARHTSPFPIGAAIALSVLGTLLFGAVVPLTDMLAQRAQNAVQMEASDQPVVIAPAADVESPTLAQR